MKATQFVLRGQAMAPYYPQGAEETDMHVRLQRLVYALKDGRTWKSRGGGIHDPAEVVARYMARLGGPTLGADRVLVPMPRSTVTPRRVLVSRWPALKLARALHDAQLGQGVVRLVHRVRDVRSARANPGNRPSIAEHIDSLELVTERLPVGGRIVLVDDVVTRGTMLAAATQMIRATGWSGTIEAFAAAWTRRPGEDGRVVAMTVEWAAGDIYPQRRLDA